MRRPGSDPTTNTGVPVGTWCRSSHSAVAGEMVPASAAETTRTSVSSPVPNCPQTSENDSDRLATSTIVSGISTLAPPVGPSWTNQHISYQGDVHWYVLNKSFSHNGLQRPGWLAWRLRGSQIAGLRCGERRRTASSRWWMGATHTAAMVKNDPSRNAHEGRRLGGVRS